jgi:DNA-binding MarR family transcriptional regulator
MSSPAIRETASFLLAQTCKRLRQQVHHRLDRLGLYGGQQFILFALWQQEGQSHSELAETLHVSPATISNAVKRMEKAGFVQRRPDFTDERISRVFLTEAGRSIRGALEETWCDMEKRAFAGFSKEESSTFRQGLKRVLENLTEKNR